MNTEEQIVGILREADAGGTVKDVCRRHGSARRRTTSGSRGIAVWAAGTALGSSDGMGKFT